MAGLHEPREEFVNQLELQLRAALRRRQLAGARTWLPPSRFATGLTVTLVALASMALGGGLVAAAYEAQRNEQRDMLLATFEQQAAIAQRRLALATERLREVEQRVAVGMAPPEAVVEARVSVTEAEVEAKAVILDIEEIRASGREPRHALSAPLVSGRDFVSERLHLKMSVPSAALELERTRARAVRSRIEVGLAERAELAGVEARLAELESIVTAFQRRRKIRQAFLAGAVTATVADLRGLEAEATGRRAALARRIELARHQVENLRTRIEVGTAQPLQLAEAELRLQELHLEMSKVEYDLLLIRQQMGK